MSGARAGPPILGGECTRIMRLGEKEYVVKHRWRPHALRGLQITTTLMNSKRSGGKAATNVAYADNNEEALCSKARQKAYDILKGTRERFERAQRKNAGKRGSGNGRRSSADSDVGCPVRAALPRRTRTSAAIPPPIDPPADKEPQEEKFDWRDTSPAFVAAMRGMTVEELLECLVGLNVPAAAQLQAELNEAQELQAGWRKAIADAAIHGRTNEGRRTFQTLLTAAAYDGGDDGPSSRVLTAKRKAEILGVHPDHLTAARRRVKSLKPDLPPIEAMDENAYWFQPRSKRSDATPPELQQ